MQRGPGCVEQMAKMAIEFVIGLFGDVAARLPPERGAFVGRLILAVARDGYWQRDVVGPFAHNRFEPVRLEVFISVCLDMQHDIGARGLTCGWCDRELAA